MQPAIGRLLKPYHRTGPSHRAGADVSFGDIVKIFGFQSIRIGRWVTSAEQQLAANLFFDALSDLQLLLQVPLSVISLNETLALTFGIGGRPGSCAHYQPQGRILALAKNAGGGSLAHEWFHAFDHYIAPRLFSLPAQERLAFASSQWLQQPAWIAHPLNDQLAQTFACLFLSQDGQQPSEFFQRCRRYDAAHQLCYYAKPEEMAARAFEQMLQRQSLKNSFLVSGCLAGPAFTAGLYPDASQSQQLATLWLGYFQQLGCLLSRQQQRILARGC